MGRCEHAVFPLGLAYIAGALKNHNVLCLDPNVADGGDPYADLSAAIDKFKPDVVGLALRNIDSVTCSPSKPPKSYYDPFVSFVKLIKEKAPNTKLLVGGAGFSLLSKEVMQQNPEIDIGVVSEGEKAFPKILENLDHPEKVSNTITRKEGKLVSAPRCAFLDFDSLPSPSWKHFDLAQYRNCSYSMGVQTKRGCVFHCLYCPNPGMVGTTSRLRKPSRVVDEIEDLVNSHGIREFYFADAVFNFPPEHALAICQEIIRRHLEIRWQADFRPDFTNFNLMKTAVDSGCAQFNFSPDGASNEALEVLNKNMTISSVLKTAEWANNIEGAKVGYCFVYDLPRANMSHYRGLLKLSTTFLPYGRKKVQSFGLTRMRIYPGTPLFELAINQRKIRPETDMISPVYYSHSGEKAAHTICSLTTGYSELFRKFLFTG